MKPINKHEQYLINLDSQIFSTKSNKWLAGRLDKNGYRRVVLDKVNVSFHRMMMETYNPIEGMENLEVNHIDGNKLNNKLENLEWVTREENMKHLVDSGLSEKCSNKGTTNGMAKLTEEDVLEIRKLHSEGLRNFELMKIYNVGKSAMSNIVNRNSWKHI